MPRRMLFLFGAPRLEREGMNVALERRKALALLAYLATMPGAHGRDTLAALLWPDADATQARANLRRALVDVREAVGPDALDAEGDRIALRPDALSVDVSRFRSCLAQVEAHRHGREPHCDECLASLAEAADLYRGDFLAGFSLRDAPDFDTWQTFQSESLRLELGEALEKLALGYGARCDIERALPHARRWLSLDPLSEPAHRCLMQLYAASGERAAAFSQYESCKTALRAELGIPPEPETTALYEQLKAGIIPDCYTLAPTEISPALRPAALRSVNNLPAATGAFIGREAELAEIAARLADPGCRLLTVLGPGGIGKTRLATEAGHAELSRLPHGACFVSLVSVNAPELVPSAVLQALGAQPAGRLTPEQQVAEFLAGREMLLILDNCEHLLAVTPEGDDVTALLRAWLDNAPGLKLLVTSRERLNLRDEWLLPLAGLELPALTSPGLPEVELDTGHNLEDHAATRFFLHCARKVRPGYSPSTDEARLIATICRQVDGTPLAIELVAPWLRALPLAEIARRLAQDLDLLSSSQRDLPDRHRSMRAAFDQSWRLLSVHERAVLRCCAVFRDGFTPEAAEAVAGATLADLAVLVDRSWLWLLPSGRYDLHELTRQYCAAKLEAEHHVETGETREYVVERHDAYYVGLMNRWEQTWRAAGYISIASSTVTADMGNFADAWLRAVERDSLDRLTQLSFLLDLCNLSTNYDLLRSLLPPTITRLQAICKRANPLQNPQPFLLSADVLLALGQCPPWRDQYEKALNYLQEGLAVLARIAPTTEGWEQARYYLRTALAFLHGFMGERAAAFTIFDEMLVSLEHIHSMLWPAYAEASLARHQADLFQILGLVLMWDGQYREARETTERSLELIKGVKRCPALCVLSETLWMQGEYQEAKQVALDALRTSRQEAAIHWLGIALMELGRIETALGEPGPARDHFNQSAAVWRTVDYGEGMPGVLTSLGQLELNMGRAAQAAELHDQALQISEHHYGNRSAYVAIALLGMGQAAAAMDDRQKAKHCFRRTLGVPPIMGRTTMETIAGIAEIIGLEGDPARATELLALVVVHPYTPAWVRVSSGKLLDDLEAELPPDVFAEAASRGRSRELDEVVAELVSEAD